MMKRKGFTLVEIMIVVAIIALLAAIAIPNLLRARLTANESSAIASLRTISSAAETFRAAQTVPGYPTDLDALTSPVPPYVSGFTGGLKAGYTFVVTGATNSYRATAAPTTPNTTGVRYFCVDHSGVLRTLASAIGASADGGCDSAATILE